MLVDRAARVGRLERADSPPPPPSFVGLEIRRQIDDLPYTLQRRVCAFDVVSLDGARFAPVVFRAGDGLVVRRVFYCDNQERWSVATAADKTRTFDSLPADVREHMHNSLCFVGFVKSERVVDLVQDAPAPDASCSSSRPPRPPRACKQSSRDAASSYSIEHPAHDSCTIWSAWLRNARFARRLGDCDNYDSLVRRALRDNQAIVDARELARAYVGNDSVLSVPDAQHGGAGAMYVGAGVEQGALFSVLLGSWSLSEPLLPGFTYCVPPPASGLSFPLYLDATRGSTIALAAHVCRGANFAFEPVIFGNRVHVAARALTPIPPNTMLTVTYTDYEQLWFACRCGLCKTLERGAFSPPPRPLASLPLPVVVVPCPPLRSALHNGIGGRMRLPSELGLPRLGADDCVFAKFQLALRQNTFDQIDALIGKFASSVQASASASRSNATHFFDMPFPSARVAAECALSIRDALIARGVTYFSPQNVHSDATTRALCLRHKQARPSSIASLDTTNLNALRRHISLASVGLASSCVRFAFESDRGFCGRVHGVPVLRAGSLVAAYAGEMLLERMFDSGALSRLDSSASLLALGSPADAADAVLICPLVVSNHARLFNHAPLTDANMSLRVFALPGDGELVALLYTTRDAQQGDELRWTYFRSSEQEALYHRA